MSFYNTGNPVPSIDPRDLDDNAKHIDELVNSTLPTFTDRQGAERRTLAGIEADADAATLRGDLANPADGAALVHTGYPGAGYDTDLQVLQRDVINSRLFGIDSSLGLTGAQFTDRSNAMLVKAGQDDFDVQYARGEFTAAGPINLTAAMLGSGDDGVSIRGAGNRRTKINYTGTGYCLNILGSGDEGASPVKRVSLTDLWVYGNANTVSDGGIKIDRAYFVELNRMWSSGWWKSDAVAARVTNVFNFMAQNFQFANGFPLPQGQAAFQIGSEGPSAWNTSNVVLLNGACQYSKNNIEVIHSSGVFDNFVVDNVTMGKAGLNSFLSDKANVNNITIRNEHLESPGFTGEGNPLDAAATHIKIAKALSVLIENNSQQDARVFIDLDSTPDVMINLGKFFETGNYDLTGNKLLKVRTATSGVNIQLNAPNIRTDQIDNLLDAVESGGFLISFDTRWRRAVSESTWNSLILAQPKLFQSQIINRVGSANAPFDQMYSADGSTFGRMMYSTQYKGERTTIPATVENQGSFYIKKNTVVQGTAGSQYIILAWITTGGGTWHEMRTLTGT